MRDETLEKMIKEADVSPDRIAKVLKPPGSFAMWKEARESRPWHVTWALGPVYLHRDSGALDRSNAKALIAAMRERFGKPGVRNGWDIFEASHPLCGWVNHLSFKVLDSKGRPTEQFRFVQAWFDYLQTVYPVADEADFSNEEMDEAERIWTHGFTNKSRVRYMREHPSEFECHSLADMLGCARGRFFGGNASEFLS